jgi:hypothetical protein
MITPRGAYALLFSFVVAGCSIHPLPDDVTGLKTSEIVRRIRCEARDGVRKKIAEWLIYRGSQDDPVAAQLGPIIYNDPRALDTFKQDQRKLKPTTLKYINYFAKSVISYNFTFDMTELNNLDATADFTKVFKSTNSIDTLALGAGLDRSRENVRTFTISDSFSVLVYQLNASTYCDGATHDPNFIYPITGKVGIDEMIDTFVDLTIFGNLGASSSGSSSSTASKSSSNSSSENVLNAQASVSKPSHAAQQDSDTTGGTSAMGDTITFTTKLSGSATPKVVIAPVTSGLADASIAAALSRTDVHKLIVGMSVPTPTDLTGTSQRSLLTQIAASTGSTPKERSLEMIAQQILRFENRRFGPSSLVFSP